MHGNFHAFCIKLLPYAANLKEKAPSLTCNIFLTQIRLAYSIRHIRPPFISRTSPNAKLYPFTSSTKPQLHSTFSPSHIGHPTIPGLFCAPDYPCNSHSHSIQSKISLLCTPSLDSTIQLTPSHKECAARSCVEHHAHAQGSIQDCIILHSFCHIFTEYPHGRRANSLKF